MSHFKYFIAKINEVISKNSDNTQKPAIIRDAYRLKTALMLMGADSFNQSMAFAINEVLKKLSLYSVHEIAEAVDVEFLNSAHDWNFITGVYSDYRIHHSEHKIVRQKILVNSLSCALLDTTLRTAVEETCFLTILKSYLIHVFNKGTQMNHSSKNSDLDIEDDYYREFYIQYRLMSQNDDSFRDSARTLLSSIEEKGSLNSFNYDWQMLSHKSFNQLFSALFNHFGSDYFDNLSYLDYENPETYQAIKAFFYSYLDNNKLSFKYPDDIEVDYFFEGDRIVERSITRYDILQENFRQSLNTEIEGVCWLLRRYFRHLKRGRDLTLIDKFRAQK